MRALMPCINQLQMQIHQALIPNFTIKGWLHAKHLTQNYSREGQLRSANLLLAIDKHLDPQLLLMETIWLVPEKGQSVEGRKESGMFFFLLPFAASLLKNLFRFGSQCRDGCWGMESGAGVRAARQTPVLPLQGQWGKSALSAAPGRACNPPLLPAVLLKGQPIC